MDDDDDIGWDSLHKPTYVVYSGLFVLSYETLFYPLDFLKTRQQYERKPMGITRIASDVYHHEGPRGLFRGFSATLAGSFPGQIVYFGAYELAKHASLELAKKWSSPTPSTTTADADARGRAAATASTAATTTTTATMATNTMPALPPKDTGAAPVAQLEETTGVTSTQRFCANLFAGFVADSICLLVYTPADIVAQRHMVATAARNNSSPSAPLPPASGARTAAAMGPYYVAPWPLEQESKTSGGTAPPSGRSVLSRHAAAAAASAATTTPTHSTSPSTPLRSEAYTHKPVHPSQQARAGVAGGLPTTRQLVRSIIKHEGFAGFYRGYWASVATFSPSSAIWFAVYELCKFELAPLWPAAAPNATTLNHLTAGAVAGFAATVIMNPFDVAKTRLQTLNAEVHSEAALIRRGFVSLLLWTVRNEGFAALMKGLGPRLWFSVPGSAITFAGYEWAKSLASLDQQ